MATNTEADNRRSRIILLIIVAAFFLTLWVVNAVKASYFKKVPIQVNGVPFFTDEVYGPYGPDKNYLLLWGYGAWGDIDGVYERNYNVIYYDTQTGETHDDMPEVLAKRGIDAYVQVGEEWISLGRNRLTNEALSDYDDIFNGKLRFMDTDTGELIFEIEPSWEGEHGIKDLRYSWNKSGNVFSIYVPDAEDQKLWIKPEQQAIIDVPVQIQGGPLVRSSDNGLFFYTVTSGYNATYQIWEIGTDNFYECFIPGHRVYFSPDFSRAVARRMKQLYSHNVKTGEELLIYSTSQSITGDIIPVWINEYEMLFIQMYHRSTIDQWLKLSTATYDDTIIKIDVDTGETVKRPLPNSLRWGDNQFAFDKDGDYVYFAYRDALYKVDMTA